MSLNVRFLPPVGRREATHALRATRLRRAQRAFIAPDVPRLLQPSPVPHDLIGVRTDTLAALLVDKQWHRSSTKESPGLGIFFA